MTSQRVPPGSPSDCPLIENVAHALVVPVASDKLINFDKHKLCDTSMTSRKILMLKGSIPDVMETVLDLANNVQSSRSTSPRELPQ